MKSLPRRKNLRRQNHHQPNLRFKKALLQPQLQPRPHTRPRLLLRRLNLLLLLLNHKHLPRQTSLTKGPSGRNLARKVTRVSLRL